MEIAALPRFALALVLALLAAASAGAQAPGARGEVMQLFSYRLTDPARFREGYRQHLAWHAERGDRLVWYAWTVQSGPRKGLFVDGTAGATWGQLDTRPDLPGDAADFAATAGPHAEAVDIETWELWRAPSTATPLEDRVPTPVLDVFLIEVAPRDAAAFERAVAALAAAGSGGPARLTWYRKLRGGAVPAYMLLASREGWSDLEASGASLPELISRGTGSPAAAAEAVLDLMASVTAETWSYEPRLSLFPGEPLAP